MKVLKVLVDADACPVKNMILQEARQRSIPVVMVMDTAHQYEDGYSQVVTVDKGADSADFQIVALAEPGDIVVTQDYGLAAMALARGAEALRQDGLLYREEMDALLFERHLSRKLRRAGVRTHHKKSENTAGSFARILGQLLDDRKEQNHGSDQ